MRADAPVATGPLDFYKGAMSIVWLAGLCGLGCVAAAGAAVLLSGRRNAETAAGGALGFLSLFLALVCAGAVLQRAAPPAENTSAEELLDRMIDRETR